MNRHEQTAGPRGLTYGILFATGLWAAIYYTVRALRR